MRLSVIYHSRSDNNSKEKSGASRRDSLLSASVLYGQDEGVIPSRRERSLSFIDGGSQDLGLLNRHVYSCHSVFFPPCCRACWISPSNWQLFMMSRSCPAARLVEPCYPSDAGVQRQVLSALIFRSSDGDNVRMLVGLALDRVAPFRFLCP